MNGELFVDNRPLIAAGASSCLATLRLRPQELHVFEDQLQVRDSCGGTQTFSCMGLCTTLIQDLVSNHAFSFYSSHLAVPLIDVETLTELEDLGGQGVVVH